MYTRLYEGILFERADVVSNRFGMRAVTQCGFRTGCGTTDALFTLNHMMEKARHKKKLLYICAVDFVKAFDTVSRSEMLARCERLGFHGKFKRMIARVFDRVQLVVEVDGQQSAPIDTSVGTKQGSKLSPLLFGWFIEQLHELIEMLEPELGMLINGMNVPDIDYADDITLAAYEEAAKLQRLLDILAEFCAIFGMKVNLDKTKIIIFHRERDYVPPCNFTLGAHTIKVVESLTYMGVHLHETSGMFGGHAVDAARAGSKALYSMSARNRQRGLKQPAFVCHLFNVLVEPVISYACQVWGPEAFAGKLDKPFNNPLAKVQLSFLRLFCGLSPQVKSNILLRELDQMPVMHHWVKLAARLWNKLCVMSHDRLIKKAFLDAIELHLDGCKACWVSRMLAAATQLGVLQAAHRSTVDSVLEIRFDESELSNVLDARFKRPWYEAADEPRSASSNDVHISTHVKWVGMAPDMKPPHLHTCLPFPLRQALMGIRTGAHHLQIQCGRFSRVARTSRVCNVAHHDVACVEDVMHFLLECSMYQPVRDRYPLLFAATSSIECPAARLRTIFASKYQFELAQGIFDMLRLREQQLQQAAAPA